jgi:hypothetical protein
MLLVETDRVLHLAVENGCNHEEAAGIIKPVHDNGVREQMLTPELLQRTSAR